jgi:hypothetical protein
MTPLEIRQTALALHSRGQPLREIARLLKLSRNTVRRILRRPDRPAREEPACDAQTLGWLRAAYARAGGNVVRVREMLLADRGLDPGYSTLTRWVREAGLREARKRSGEYTHAPGAEMQHDTSPHRVRIGGKTVATQCAGLALANSHRLFIQYYPRYTRFEAKHFLLESARFNDGTCPVCVIDNTSVMVAHGSGAGAVFAPEMEAFARTLGFGLLAHAVGHPDRKALIERPFSYVEGNFLAGREFRDYDDLNRRALDWCRDVANARPKRSLGMSPEAAYAMEKPYLRPLPAVLPPVYEVLERVADLYGFVSVDTVRYSVPDRWVGQPLTVYKYQSEIQIFRRDRLLAVHPRLIGVRGARHVLPGHHTVPAKAARAPALEARLLRGSDPVMDRYVAALSLRSRGARPMRRLLEMQRTYPREPFLAAVAQALEFGLYDLGRLEEMVLKYVAGDFFNLDDDIDDA